MSLELIEAQLSKDNLSHDELIDLIINHMIPFIDSLVGLDKSGLLDSCVIDLFNCKNVAQLRDEFTKIRAVDDSHLFSELVIKLESFCDSVSHSVIH